MDVGESMECGTGEQDGKGHLRTIEQRLQESGLTPNLRKIGRAEQGDRSGPVRGVKDRNRGKEGETETNVDPSPGGHREELRDRNEQDPRNHLVCRIPEAIERSRLGSLR